MNTLMFAAALAGFVYLYAAWSAAEMQTTAQPKNKRGTYAALANIPEKARMMQNPLENEPDAAAAGNKLFLQHCAECHGKTAHGSRRGPSLQAQQVQEASPGSLFWILTNGVVRRGMPVWSKLPEVQRWQIITFVKSLRALEDPRDPPLASPK